MRFMFDTDEAFSFETLRAVGYSVYGGADIGEVMATAARITPGDPDSWYQEWRALADRIATIAEGSVIGELSFFDGATRSAMVRALTPALLAELSPAEFDAIAGRYQDGGHAYGDALVHWCAARCLLDYGFAEGLELARAAALAFAALPALAYLIKVPLEQVLPPEPRPDTREMVQTLRCLAGGFIVTSLLWGAALAMILDGKLKAAALYFALAAVFAFFGVIHSPLQSEQLGLPWDILAQLPKTFAEAVRFQTPYHWAGAYGLIALMLVALALVPSKPNETKS